MNFREWLSTSIEPETSLKDWVAHVTQLNEGSTTHRYSVEVNYRSTMDEVLKAFAKIALGYVSAAMKQNGYHVKIVLEQEPMRVLVSSRNWDDGEWCAVATFNPKHEGGSFMVANGFYIKERKTIEIQHTRKCSGDSAADVTRELRNMMHELHGKQDRHLPELKPVHMKPGPKR